jgi:hypothetical protein
LRIVARGTRRGFENLVFCRSTASSLRLHVIGLGRDIGSSTDTRRRRGATPNNVRRRTIYESRSFIGVDDTRGSGVETSRLYLLNGKSRWASSRREPAHQHLAERRK